MLIILLQKMHHIQLQKSKKGNRIFIKFTLKFSKLNSIYYKFWKVN
jgi:hypothetical protein